MRVNAIWIGDRLPLLQRVCAASWVANGHEYHLWTYGEVLNVPYGVVIRDASTVLPGKIYLYQDRNHKDSPVLHANLFRYAFLAKHGGSFVDTDTLCLRWMLEPTTALFSSEGKSNHPNWAFVHTMEPNSEIALRCMSEAWRRLESEPHEWGRFGPALLKDCIENVGMQEHILPSWMWCKIHWNQTDQFFSDKPPDVSQCCGIHFWSQILRKRKIDLEHSFPAPSIWQYAKNRYAIA